MPRRKPAKAPTPAALVERLEPLTGHTWLSLMPGDADDYTRLLFRLLHEGVVEAWSSDDGAFHLVLSGETGGVPGPAPGPRAPAASGHEK